MKPLIPKPFPDELLYSILARTMAHTGYPTYRSFRNEVMLYSNEYPAIEFRNNLKPEVQEKLGLTVEETLQHHTIFPFLIRFMMPEKRNKLWRISLSSETRFLGLYTPERTNESYLRYCPLCVREQRQQYGECYWSRLHQIPGVNFCPMHGCRLLLSDVPLFSKQSPNFHPADIICKEGPILYGSKPEQDFCKYAGQIISKPVDTLNETPFSEVLSASLVGTRYLTKGGLVRNTSQLTQDIRTFYKDMTLYDNGIQDSNTITRLFHGTFHTPLQTVQLAFFLRIPIQSILNPMPATTSPRQEYVQAIIQLYTKGTKPIDISRKMGVSKSAVNRVLRDHGFYESNDVE